MGTTSKDLRNEVFELTIVLQHGFTSKCEVVILAQNVPTMGVPRNLQVHRSAICTLTENPGIKLNPIQLDGLLEKLT